MHRKETRKYLENKWTKLAEAKSSPLDVAFCGEALVSDRWSMYRRKKRRGRGRIRDRLGCLSTNTIAISTLFLLTNGFKSLTVFWNVYDYGYIVRFFLVLIIFIHAFVEIMKFFCLN